MREDFPVYESSPEMKQRGVPGRAGKYPWRQLNLGQSFFVGKDEIKRTSLQTLIYRQGKQLDRKFRIIDHPTGYEVGCIAIGSNAGSFSTAPSPAIAQIVEKPTGNAPLGWPVLNKGGE